jgi:hypothetical protein
MVDTLVVNAGGLLNIFYRQGKKFLITVTVKDQAGAVLNLTGYTARGVIRKNPATAQLIAFTCVITDAVNGKFTASFTSAQGAALPAGLTDDSESGTLFYELEVMDGSGESYGVLSGIFQVAPEATY